MFIKVNSINNASIHLFIFEPDSHTLSVHFQRGPTLATYCHYHADWAVVALFNVGLSAIQLFSYLSDIRRRERAHPHLEILLWNTFFRVKVIVRHLGDIVCTILGHPSSSSSHPQEVAVEACLLPLKTPIYLCQDQFRKEVVKDKYNTAHVE